MKLFAMLRTNINAAIERMSTPDPIMMCRTCGHTFRKSRALYSMDLHDRWPHCPKWLGDGATCDSTDLERLT